MKAYIYAIVNNINGKLLVGQTNNYKRRILEHKRMLEKNIHENPHLQFAYNFYGASNFSYKLLEQIEGSQVDFDKTEENYRLKFLPNVYNLRTGGNGGCKFNEETKKRMSQSQCILAASTNSEKQRRAANIRWSAPESKIWRIKMNKKIWNDKTTKMKMIQASQNSAKRRGQKQAKKYDGFVSPNGEIYSPIINLHQFCRIHNLDRGNLLKVYKKLVHHHKGWTKYDIA